jgi:predicted alpha-1,2-mannosidase
MHLARSLVAAVAAGALVGSLMAVPATAAAQPGATAAPAALVNPLIGTSGGVHTFPGPDMPFGMIQWSPDTSPSRPDGGGYEYDNSQISGFSLTHISGPGCPAYGDIPILPFVGAIPANPGGATANFSHTSETAKTGYYKVTTQTEQVPTINQPKIMSKIVAVTASGENPPNDVATNLIDANVNTKWLTLTNTGWVQFKFSEPATISDYALTSANDESTRDPKNWTLQGSSDGTSWTTLDTQTNAFDAARLQTKEFPFSNTQQYTYYRLNITANQGGRGLQLAEVQLSDSAIEPGIILPPNLVTTQLTTTMRAGIAQFSFPASTQSNLLLKVAGTDSRMDATTAHVVGNNEVTGSVTAGHFCNWMPGSSTQRSYTLHFDIKFEQPFASSGTWAGGPNGGPGGVYLTFDTTGNQTVTAKVGISFTSDANASSNLSSEIPGWDDFGAVRSANEQAWNQVLSRIEISGGTPDQQTQFYTALYHSLLHPNVFSDVNGQYMGMDGTVHTAAAGHEQYANYSGWDIYRSQVQLAALVAPQQTSDSVRSMLNGYDQSGMLPKWAQANGESYVMVGDPADPIIADAYAFGARDFDAQKALQAMVTEATQTSNIRPGQAVLDQYGYLPYDLQYGCCNFDGTVSTQLEYDSADYAIAALAKSLGHHDTYTKFATRAQNWQNTFNPATGYVQARLANGQWVPGFTPSTGTGMVEGTSAQYTPMVPFNLKALIAARGGNQAWESYLDSLFTNLANPSSTNADLSNEPSLEIPWEYNYVGAPWKTQQVVRQAQQQLYFNAPVGQFGNDDLGAMSSWYVWSELGLYPETPGTDTLVIGSPVFPHAVIHLANGKDITIDAPKAATDAPYVQNLQLNGKDWPKTYLTGNQYQHGATLTFDLGTTPNTSWGSGPSAAPPSDATGEQAALAPARPALTSVSPANGLILRPGSSGSASFDVINPTSHSLTMDWTASAASGVTVSPTSGSLTIPASSSGTVPVTVTAGQNDGSYSVTFSARTASGESLGSVTVAIKVPRLWPHSGNWMWYSGMKNNMNATLTRSVSVPAAGTTTLDAWLLYETEPGSDYIYGEVSTDGGATWQRVSSPLSGSSNGWREESWDLTPFAGHETLFRLRYSTDNAVLERGVYVDDFSVATDGEVIWSDDVETGDAGWQISEFSRVEYALID